MTSYKTITTSDVRQGDNLRLTNGATSIVGKVNGRYERDGFYLYFGVANFVFVSDKSTEWTIEREVPSAYDQYKALKPGTEFTLTYENGVDPSTDDKHRIKLDDTNYAYYNGYAWGTIHADFGAVVSVTAVN